MLSGSKELIDAKKIISSPERDFFFRKSILLPTRATLLIHCPSLCNIYFFSSFHDASLSFSPMYVFLSPHNMVQPSLPLCVFFLFLFPPHWKDNETAVLTQRSDECRVKSAAHMPRQGQSVRFSCTQPGPSASLLCHHREHWQLRLMLTDTHTQNWQVLPWQGLTATA